MSKFKKGDRVEALGTVDGMDHKGKRGVVVCGRGVSSTYELGVEFDEDIGGHSCSDMGKKRHCRWGNTSEFKLLPLLDYDRVRARIDALENGWDEDADNILQEINAPYNLMIPSVDRGKYQNAIFIVAFEGNTFLDEYGQRQCVESFKYSNQCEKLEAFKCTLLWLLDHSDIKKTIVGTTQKAEIEGKVYKVKIIEESE